MVALYGARRRATRQHCSASALLPLASSSDARLSQAEAEYGLRLKRSRRSAAAACLSASSPLASRALATRRTRSCPSFSLSSLTTRSPTSDAPTTSALLFAEPSTASSCSQKPLRCSRKLESAPSKSAACSLRRDRCKRN
eukprot:766460-Hanusia_phi.AAC.3